MIMPKEAKRDGKDKPRRGEDSIDEDEFIECKYTNFKINILKS